MDTMDSIVEKLLLALLEKTLTPNTVKMAEKYVKQYAVKLLEDLAKSTDNKIDDYIVGVVKEAFEMKVPV